MMIYIVSIVPEIPTITITHPFADKVITPRAPKVQVLNDNSVFLSWEDNDQFTEVHTRYIVEKKLYDHRWVICSGRNLVCLNTNTTNTV